jgi:Xaa-Pro dipeptidase
MTLFTREEYLERIGHTKRRMEAAGIDTLLICSPENINYLTGYAGWSFYTPQAAILRIDADEPVFITRAMDVACAEYSAFLRRDNVIGYPESYIGTVERHPMEFIASFIREQGWDRGYLGIEKNAHFFSIRSFEVLQARLSAVRIVDADLLVDWVRLIKSESEIQLMRQAGVLAGCAMQAAYDKIAPGVRQCDAAAALYHGQLAGTAEFGGSVPNAVLMPAGEKTSAPHLKWTDDPYQNNQGINIELSGSRHQYHVALARPIYLGSPPEELRRLCSVVSEAITTAIDAVKPGIPVEDVVAVWRSVVTRAGYEKASRIGYAIGLCFQPTWIERTVSLQMGERAELRPNMTFHMVCGMWGGKHSMTMSESFRVSESGHELLTHFPRELLVKQ